MTLPISYNVVKSLEAALWAFYRSNTFGKGALLAANLGDDADMTAAVYGQLAGSFYGAAQSLLAGLGSSPCENSSPAWRMRSLSFAPS
jgi:ADP-ribosylglycohydrolase